MVQTFGHSSQIDEAWITPDIEIHIVYFLSLHFGVEYHRGIILDIPQYSLLGGTINEITCHIAHCLQFN